MRRLSGRRASRGGAGSHPRAAPTGTARARRRRARPSPPAATTAPASTWCARPTLTPSSSARSADAIREMNAVHLRQAGAGEHAAGPRAGRARRGAGQPGQRAERLAGGDDAVRARRRRAAASPARRASSSTCSRSSAISAFDGGSSSNHSRVSRAAPSGTENATAGSSSRAGRELQRAAADVEADQVARAPAEPAAHGEEGQPRLVLAGEHAEVDAGLLRAPASSTRALLPASRTADVAKREQLVAAELLGLVARDDRGLDQRVGAGAG